MIRRHDKGFTLVELMLVMLITVLFLAGASSVFTSLLTQFKQQSKIGETSIEGIIGLEIMRQDIESAGYGLPWALNGAVYQEAAVESKTTWIDRDLNDGPPNNPGRAGNQVGETPDAAGASNAPAAIRTLVGVAQNNSDVLSVKSISVAQNGTSQKWTEMFLGSSGSAIKKTGNSDNTFANTDKVIVLTLTRGTSTLIHSASSAWATTYANTAPFAPGTAPATNTGDVFVVYGVDPNTPLRMPFNRADYYVRVPTSLPARCASGTGVLYKAVVSQLDGTLPTELPLLDCVAAMRVVVGMDVNNNGNITYMDHLENLTASDIRNQLREVRVYILAQEGQIDYSYTFPKNTVTLGGDVNLPLTINMTFIANYAHYRWKPYVMIARPGNLRGT